MAFLGLFGKKDKDLDFDKEIGQLGEPNSNTSDLSGKGTTPPGFDENKFQPPSFSQPSQPSELSQTRMSGRENFESQPAPLPPSSPPPIQTSEYEEPQKSQTQHSSDLNQKVQILSAKVDTINAKLDAINQRLMNIEKLATKDEQKNKYNW